MVTVSSSAQAGAVVFTATYNGATKTASLTLTKATTNSTVTIAAVAGNVYDITVSANKVRNFSGMEIRLEYDASVFDSVNLHC